MAGDRSSREALRTTLRLRRLLTDVAAGLFERPVRTLLTASGVALSIGALVSTVGLAQSGRYQVLNRFDALAATTIRVLPQDADPTRSAPFPDDAVDRLEALDGVTSAATLAAVDLDGAQYQSRPSAYGANQAVAVDTYAASPHLLDVVDGTMRQGRYFDVGHVDRGDAVAVVGPIAASKLGVGSLARMPALFVGDEAVTIIGVLDDVATRSELLDAVIVPFSPDGVSIGTVGAGEALVRTEIGMAHSVALALPFALDPGHPGTFETRVPPEPEEVRAGVSSDLGGLIMVLGGVSVLVGTVGIANITLVSVLERTSEIGLRRALGAKRSHIGVQFLLESGCVGLAGGAAGASVGVVVVVATAAARQWTPVLDPRIAFAGPLIGMATGLLAGAYPALRAARLEPVDALRSS